ncbi:hypothetical protein NN3_35990 [Nocardia neocaledoniensis NBRC 108232]|uniref:DUF1254 domain-containing protein n=1 Tax=Nocardia neocaledoniensis TaxID=236511 RepID=A0A317NCA3_9NOCA|nr:DUF1214 domain-containing protein [Nocardia neocaledoniensis]PWV72735.1 hypothetical protein DFR69_10844 [Nocardia neocaledoniensis]GEM32592.1 hypothetical protein NN3_35990 [Nocardia neocaledoniensis NBRC 108232]
MAERASTWAPTEDQIRQCYIYLLSRFLVIRQELTDRAEDGFAYNRIKYNPLGSADFVNPNFDVAYLEAWFAVDDDTAVLLEVPEVRGRYYTAQVLDEWGEVIFNINERTTPSKPFGTFALVKPGTDPAIADGATRIDLHSAKAKMLARVEIGDDPDGALALQRKFAATPLGPIEVAEPPKIPAFDNANLLGVDIFDNLGAVLGSALDVSPAAFAMQVLAQSIAGYLAADPGARERVDTFLRETVVPEFKEYALTQGAPYVNRWMGGSPSGNYGADYTVRTIVNLLGIWANTSDEVVYFNTSRAADGKPLDGADSYVIDFPAEGLPDSVVVDGYWSVILVSVPDFRVIPNALHRYNFNNYSPLTYEPDGSLRIGIGPKPVAGVPESNWLPSAPGQPFSLTFRCYVPKSFVGGGGWAPPPLTAVH